MAGYAGAWGTVYDCDSSSRLSGAYCYLRDNYGYWVSGYTNSSGYFYIARYFPGYSLTLRISKSGYYTRYWYGNTSSYIVYYYCLNRRSGDGGGGGGGWT